MKFKKLRRKSKPAEDQQRTPKKLQRKSPQKQKRMQPASSQTVQQTPKKKSILNLQYKPKQQKRNPQQLKQLRLNKAKRKTLKALPKNKQLKSAEQRKQSAEKQQLKEETAKLFDLNKRKVKNNCIACSGKGVSSKGDQCFPCAGNGIGLPEIGEIFFTKNRPKTSSYHDTGSSDLWHCIAVRPGIGDKALVKGRFCGATKIFKRSQVKLILREW